MLTATQLAQARATQETIMTAQCVIRGPGDGWVWDGAASVPAPGPVVYSGKCRWQRASLSAQVVSAGRQDVTVARFVGAIPWEQADIFAGFTLEVTAADDPALLGTYTLTEVEASSFATCRRLHGERP